MSGAAGARVDGPRPLQRALASEEASTLRGRRGDVDAAEQLLDRALGLYAKLDAARDVARAWATLRDLGSVAVGGARAARSCPHSSARVTPAPP